MELLLVILASLCLVLLCVLLAAVLRRKDAGANGLREGLAADFDRSAKNMGELMLQAQRLAAEVQQKELQLIKEQMNEKLEDTRKGLLDRIATIEPRLQTMEQSSEQKLENIRKTVAERLSYLQEENNRKLEGIQKVVDEKLQKTLESKMNESFKLVSERLEQVYTGLGEMKSIAVGVGDLKKVLTNVKNRGILGEIQLGAILSDILSPEQYDTDVATVKGSSNRVEFAVKLPGAEQGEHIYLPIDSKFPGDTFAALQDAYATGEAEAIAAAKKTLEQTVKKCAKDIRDKYVKPPHTTNFGILFLPFEGLYAEVVSSGIIETLQREYSINVTGPSTMAAMLNSLQMGFRTLAIQKRSDEVWRLLGLVKSEFETFEDVLNSTQKHLKQVDDDLEKLIGVRTRQINRRLRDVEVLDAPADTQMLE